MTTAILAAMVAFGGFGKPETFVTEPFAYRGKEFTSFVTESYRTNNVSNPEGFYSWFEDAAKEHGMPDGLQRTLSTYKAKIHAAKTPQAQAEVQKELGTLIHKTVKASIPKFNLDRGFEFVHVVDRGERQCYLQSILVAGLLQKAGVDSGVAMVWKNLSHQETNNGHAVAVERLADGHDIIVDCSDPVPFVKHEGLFMRSPKGGYKFVSLVFDGDKPDIAGYRAEGDGKPIHPKSLDLSFIRSQFDYYRGERAPGGFFLVPRTPEGLQASASFLEKAVKENPDNPLAEYVLGHVYKIQKKMDLARKQYKLAYGIYERQGWIPDGPREAARL